MGKFDEAIEELESALLNLQREKSPTLVTKYYKDLFMSLITRLEAKNVKR